VQVRLALPRRFSTTAVTGGHYPRELEACKPERAPPIFPPHSQAILLSQRPAFCVRPTLLAIRDISNEKGTCRCTISEQWSQTSCHRRTSSAIIAEHSKLQVSFGRAKGHATAVLYNLAIAYKFRK
jgi:hypothetical protein